MFLFRRAICFVAVVCATGCRTLEPAPEDLEGLLHHLWLLAEDGDEDRVAEAVAGLDRHFAELPLDGTMGPMDAEGIEAAGLDWEPKPGQAVGMWIGSELPCTLSEVEAIVTHPDQHVLYDIFDDYQREFDGSRKAFLDGQTDTLDWTVVYEVSIPLASTYVAELRARIRRMDGFLISRTVLVEPATWEKGDHVFDQDYRVEVYTAEGKGRARHVEGLWRHMDAGVVKTDNEGIQRSILNGLADWDEQTGTWCEAGLP